MDFIRLACANTNNGTHSHYNHNYRFYRHAQLSHERLVHPETIHRASIKIDLLIKPACLL